MHIGQESQQLELPTVFENLLQKLRSTSTGSCLQSLHGKDLQTNEFGSIFGGPRNPELDGRLSEEHIRKLRLLVIAAVGQSRTLKVLNLSNDQENSSLKLTLGELKALLNSLQSSPVLAELNLDGQICTEYEAKEVGVFLKVNSCLEILHTKIPDEFLDSEAVDGMTKPLRESGNGHPALKYWHGFSLLEAPSVGRILMVCPKLHVMSGGLGRLSQWQCQNKLSAEKLAGMYLDHEVLHSVSLIGKAWPLSVFMRCLMAHKNTRRKKKLKSLRLYCRSDNPPHLSPRLEQMWEGDYSLLKVDTGWMEGNLVPSLLSAAIELETFGFYRLKCEAEEWQKIFRALKHTPHFQSFGCSCDLKVGFDAHCWDGLISLIQTSSNLQILELECFPGYGHIQRGFCDLLYAISSHRSLRKLVLDHFIMNDGDVLALTNCIQANKALEDLELSFCEVDGAKIGQFFSSLGKNTDLRNLDLHGTKGLTGEALRELMGALQKNSSLQDINIQYTSWDQSGIKATIDKILKQKGRKENYMTVMKQYLRREEFKQSNVGRLFLCGGPCAGKTQLRQTMMKLVADSSRRKLFRNYGLPESFFGRSLRRTEGVEIELMIIDEMRIFIWDLAGQEIYRALHDCLFPKLDIPCVFLFVFSPYDRDRKCEKVAPNCALRDEILPWLRFIASNSRVEGSELPRVKILVSHKDKLEDKYVGWAKIVIMEIRSQFKDLLAIDVRVLSANNKAQHEGVAEVLDRIRVSFKEILKQSGLKVPQICLEISDALCIRKSQSTSKPKSRKIPILGIDEFFSFCKESSCTEVQGNYLRNLKLFHALKDFLHDTGSILHFPKTGLVVVDVNWFTYSFLGQLIGIGHGFQQSRVSSNTSLIRSDGLIKLTDFRDILLTVVGESDWKDFRSLDNLVLKLLELMEEMDLCFRINIDETSENCSDVRVFAPILFAEPRESSRVMRRLPEWSLEVRNPTLKPTYVGLRLQCRDSKRTNLSPSFFPRLQVFLRNSLISKHTIFKNLIVCKYNLINLTADGYEIHVENDGLVAGDHIDVLVRSFRTHNETMKYTLQHVVEGIQRFCASPRGCPGVKLAVSILRSDCVENFTLSALRDEKVAIAIDTLMSDWKLATLQRVMEYDYTLTTDDDETHGGYFHTWPAAEKAGLTVVAEKAKDLLLEEHFKEIVSFVRGCVDDKQKKMTLVETEILQKFDSVIGDQMLGGGSPSNLGPINTRIRRLTSDVVTRSDYGHHQLHHIGQSVNKLGNKVDDVGNRVDDVKRLVQQVLSEVKIIKAFQENLQQSLTSFSRSLDRVVGISTSKPNIPRRPYFISGNVGRKHWITARIQIGKALKLHFMCERKSGSHCVEGQEGYPVVVEKGNKDVLRFLSMSSINIFGYLVKAGFQVGARLALGSAIPDLELPGLGEYMTLTETASDDLLQKMETCQAQSVEKGYSPRVDVVQKSWTYLHQLFELDLKDRCSELFHLHRCQYLSNSGPIEPVYAWLCRDCVRRGLSNGSIQTCV